MHYSEKKSIFNIRKMGGVKMDKYSTLNFYRKGFKRLFDEESRPVSQRISDIVSSGAETIVSVFYSILLSHENAKIYLNSDEVENRLKATLTGWIRNLVEPKSADDINEYISTQLKVGNVHARINIPMTLVDYGGRIIKQEINRRLV